VARTAPARRASRRYHAAIAFVAVGLGLTLAFFPEYFNRVTSYDDEGSFLVLVDRFLHHGSLYDHTYSGYGPFYFLYTGVIYRTLGQSPTLFTARLIVAALTMLSVIGFAAAVWKVTRSIVLGVLCEVATFVVLVHFAGYEPLHPGSMIVLLVAVMAYGFAGYAMERRTAYLVVIGAAAGALLMTKVNVGLFAVAAIVIGFVAGNPRFPRWFRVAVVVGAVVMPFAITSQLLNEMTTAQLAVLVSFTLLMTLVALHADPVTLPPRELLVTATAAAGAVLVSWVWPLATGTSLPRLLYGVFIHPLRQTDNLTIAFEPKIIWITIVLTVVGAYLVTARRRGLPTSPVPPRLIDAALASTGAVVLGLALFSGNAAWMPAIVLLPMLAFLAKVPRRVRIALRFLVPFAILQMLHAYPVAGSQLKWGMVAMCVPCVIGLGAGLERLALWRITDAPVRVALVGALCSIIVLAAGVWPVSLWDRYLKAEPLDLRGARLVRVDPETKDRLQSLTSLVRRHCDTFYSAPGLNSLYVFTGLPTPSGMLASWPGVLDEREQRELAEQLAAADERERVCVVRNMSELALWRASSYGEGPLGDFVAQYRRRVGQVYGYTVSVRGDLRDEPQAVGPKRGDGSAVA
jgi:hypothetical protein